MIRLHWLYLLGAWVERSCWIMVNKSKFWVKIRIWDFSDWFCSFVSMDNIIWLPFSRRGWINFLRPCSDYWNSLGLGVYIFIRPHHSWYNNIASPLNYKEYFWAWYAIVIMMRLSLQLVRNDILVNIVNTNQRRGKNTERVISVNVDPVILTIGLGVSG